MTKKEFLDILTESLAGNVPASEIEENIRYYKDYIESGEESEEKALEQLGDPHLIARTIIDSFIASKGPMADFYKEQARNEYSRTTSGEENSGEGTDYRQYEYKRGFGHSIRWYEKILLLVLVIGIIAFVLFLGGLAAVIIIRIVLPVAVLFFVIKLISDYFRRG